MIVAIIILILIFIIADIYHYVFSRNKGLLIPLLMDKKNHSAQYYEKRDSLAEKLRCAPQERYEMRSERGELLKGYYLPCGEGKSKKIAFIVHGYRSEHAETAGMFLDYYHSRGFDVFTCDHAAHGESEGKHIGYDYFESADCLSWLDFLVEQFGEDISVVLHGFSMGGATVMKMSDRLPGQVKFVCEDSGFISGEEILRSQLGPMFSLMDFLNGIIAGYKMRDTDVSENLRNAKTPFLVVHGFDDPTVPFSMAPRAYELIPTEKDSLFTAGVKHIESMHFAEEAYIQKLDAFIDKYTAAKT